MTTQEIVSKLWNLCNVLLDDGITYHQYVTELTYILFLKMAKETGTEEVTDKNGTLRVNIPVGYRWDDLVSKSGIELKKFYKELLNHLGENCTGRVREIYQGSATNIEEPKNLEKIITTIDGLDWYSAREEGLGNLYEGLLEKNETICIIGKKWIPFFKQNHVNYAISLINIRSNFLTQPVQKNHRLVHVEI